MTSNWAGRVRLVLLAGVVLGAWLAVGSWVLESWRQSPLDRQGPWLLLLTVPWLLILSRPMLTARDAVTDVALTSFVHLLWLALLAISGALALALDIHAAQALVAVLWLGVLLAMLGVRPRLVVVLVLLLALALPTVSFVLGSVLHRWVGLSYASGGMARWALAFALLVWAVRFTGWLGSLVFFLALCALYALLWRLFDAWPLPAFFLAWWGQPALPGVLAALAAELILGAWWWRRQKTA